MNPQIDPVRTKRAEAQTPGGPKEEVQEAPLGDEADRQRLIAQGARSMLKKAQQLSVGYRPVVIVENQADQWVEEIYQTHHQRWDDQKLTTRQIVSEIRSLLAIRIKDQL